MTFARRAAAAGLALALAAGACGCRAGRPAPNVLLISIDSLRADHPGCYGYPRDTSPTLDRIAAGGERFENAQSPTSWTLPAHVTLLTGRAQHRHRTLSERDRIPEGERLLPEVFAEHGTRRWASSPGRFSIRSSASTADSGRISPVALRARAGVRRSRPRGSPTPT